MKKKEFEFVFDFPSIAARNKFLDKQYPERKRGNPGIFKIKGGLLGVRSNRVKVKIERKGGADV